MNMVGHQTPSEHVDTGASTPLSDEFDVPAVVGLAEKRLLPPISTLRHVMGDTGDDNASCAWHGSSDRTMARNIERTLCEQLDQIMELSPITPELSRLGLPIMAWSDSSCLGFALSSRILT